jgi:hypothetical protein
LNIRGKDTIRPKDLVKVICSIESDADSEGEESQDEGRKAIVRRVENRPGQEEVDEHNVSHVPFRSWCKHCVKGKAVNRGHSRSVAVSEVPVISIDYAFVNENGEERKKRKEREREREVMRVTARIEACL